MLNQKQKPVIGQKCRVVSNTSGHFLSIGDELDFVDFKNNEFGAFKNSKGFTQWLMFADVEPINHYPAELDLKFEAVLHALKTVQLRYNESFEKEHQELVAKAISYATN